MTLHKCQNCDTVHEEDDLKEIQGLEMRVAPGEPMPSGECPLCGALCQPTDDDQRLSTAEERELVADQYPDPDIQVDDDAMVAVIEDSENIWVQAWVLVRKQ